MLVIAAAMAMGAIGLAPFVIEYWGARLGVDAVGRPSRTAAQALRPERLAPAAIEGEPRPGASSEQRLPGSRRTPPVGDSAVQKEPSLTLESTAELDGTAELDASDAGSAPARQGPATPRVEAPNASFVAPAPAATSARETAIEGAPEAQHHPEEAPTPERASPIETRSVSITLLEGRTQPGLCSGSERASDAHAALARRFQAVSWDGSAQLHLDPRLGPDAPEMLSSELALAEGELWRVLRLRPARPDVFAYFDIQLLRAAGCINDDVIAYYDGALHVVLTHDDMGQSVAHEYTHHALMAAGLTGPAWAHEGIAMHVAGETWWRTAGWLERLLERPFSLEVMESAIPYTLRSDQAALFYVQAAAMVACAIEPRGRLAELVAALAAGHDQGQLHYALPEGAAPAAWRTCFSELARSR